VGEALSSWLSRLAALYSMSVVQLLENNVGPASALARRAFDDDLDWNPPAELLDALAERTGTALGDLRMMTISGWVPCPVCATDPSHGTQLTATLPLMLSCPEHRCRLEDGSTIALAATLDRPLPHRTAPEHVLALDRLTHKGLATGTVTLPRRTVHVGVWLRLLRTLLDEVSISTSRVRQHSIAALDLIWNTAGLPPRAGLNVWRPYERLDSERQEAMLEAAACALNLIQTGEIFARGTLGPLLTPCRTSRPTTSPHPANQPDTFTATTALPGRLGRSAQERLRDREDRPDHRTLDSAVPYLENPDHCSLRPRTRGPDHDVRHTGRVPPRSP
jgi:hypothetical protein